MRFPTILLGAIAILSACSTNELRYTAVEDSFSIRDLPGWPASRERESVVFRGPGPLTETSVVIRSVAMENVRPHARERKGLVRATATVLAGLPVSVVSKARPGGHPELEGARFDVTFEPPGRSRRYQRTQVALVGERHVFHLMHTSPDGDLGKSADLFDQVVASLEEL